MGKLKKKVIRRELRLVNPPEYIFEYIHRLAKEGHRTVPQQMCLIFEGYYKQDNTKQSEKDLSCK